MNYSLTIIVQPAIFMLLLQLFHEPLHPYHLLACFCSYNILSLSSGQCNYILQFRDPTNCRVTNTKHITYGAFAIYVTNHVCINISLQNNISTSITQPSIECPSQVSKNPLDCILVLLSWIIHEPSNNSHCMSNVWSSAHHSIHLASNCPSVGYFRHVVCFLLFFLCLTLLTIWLTLLSTHHIALSYYFQISLSYNPARFIIT